eukprot:m.32343 g.32343  ORF g.32343 m.32343 type:complete len:69 (-) comp7036_c1_seq1:713-919(-)
MSPRPAGSFWTSYEDPARFREEANSTLGEVNLSPFASTAHQAQSHQSRLSVVHQIAPVKPTATIVVQG